MPKMDRRIQRTRELLQKALIELIDERGYDAVTIQDIVERANIGRTTFYKHYNGKDDLFMSCHEAIVSSFQFERLYTHPLSREELLEREASPSLVLAFQQGWYEKGPRVATSSVPEPAGGVWLASFAVVLIRRKKLSEATNIRWLVHRSGPPS